MIVLPFPAPHRPAKRGRATTGAASEPASGVAAVAVFPRSRHKAIVQSIADEMKAKQSDDEAEAVLVDHMELEAAFLERLGVSEDDVMRDCRAFAVAVWKLVLQGADAESIA